MVRSPGEADTRERFVELRDVLERLDEKPPRLVGSIDPAALPGCVLLGCPLFSCALLGRALLERPPIEPLVPKVAIGEPLVGNVLEVSAGLRSVVELGIARDVGGSSRLPGVVPKEPLLFGVERGCGVELALGLAGLLGGWVMGDGIAIDG